MQNISTARRVVSPALSSPPGGPRTGGRPRAADPVPGRPADPGALRRSPHPLGPGHPASGPGPARSEVNGCGTLSAGHLYHRSARTTGTAQRPNRQPCEGGHSSLRAGKGNQLISRRVDTIGKQYQDDPVED
ncbi:hypothetical protein GCM10017688_51560 [Streptomyces ramulosus]